jgi:heme-degrading monooxygenase HmoA
LEVPDGYAQTAELMMSLAKTQPGFLGVDSLRNADGFGITVSYWRDEASIKAWREHADHATARKAGRAKWYRAFTARVCRVEREYSHSMNEQQLAETGS